MFHEYQIQHIASVGEVNVENLIAAARTERAKIVRAYLSRIFRRQAQPAFTQPAMQAI